MGKAPSKIRQRRRNGSARPPPQGDEDAKKALADMQSDVPVTSPVIAPDPSPRFVSGKINIIFKDAVPGAFENGRATSCTLVAGIYNDTKYHLTKVSFKIGDWSFIVDDELNANTRFDTYRVKEISLRNGTICSDQAAFVSRSIKTAGIFDCAMPGVAEGDCQNLVVISSALDDGAVERISKAENVLGAKQTAPLREAIVKAGLDKPVAGAIPNDRLAKLASLLDTFVTIDSQSWSFNEYNPGSMNTVTVVNKTPNGSTIRLKGFYTFRQQARTIQGWVIAVIENGSLKCLEYHDFAGECRAIQLPDAAARQ